MLVILTFSEQFRTTVNRFKKIHYDIDVLRQTACIVVNPIMFDNSASLEDSGHRPIDSSFLNLFQRVGALLL